jgi:hypothetical protein
MALNTASMENFLPAMLARFARGFVGGGLGPRARVFDQLGAEALVKENDLGDGERSSVGQTGIVAGALEEHLAIRRARAREPRIRAISHD